MTTQLLEPGSSARLGSSMTASDNYVDEVRGLVGRVAAPQIHDVEIPCPAT